MFEELFPELLEKDKKSEDTKGKSQGAKGVNAPKDMPYVASKDKKYFKRKIKSYLIWAAILAVLILSFLFMLSLTDSEKDFGGDVSLGIEYIAET